MKDILTLWACNCLQCDNTFYVTDHPDFSPKHCCYCGVPFDFKKDRVRNGGDIDSRFDSLYKEIRYPPPPLPFEQSDLPDIGDLPYIIGD